MKFIDTTNTVPFDSIEIGHLFYFKGNIWVRNDVESGKCIKSTNGIDYGCCNFMIAFENDGEPEQVHHINMEDIATLIIHSQSEISNENVD